MPPRRTAVHRIAVNRLVGDGVFWFTHGEPDPKTGVTSEQYDAAVAQADEEFVVWVDSVDWVRVLRDAACDHQTALAIGDDHHVEGSGIPDVIDGHVCGWCLRSALLHERK